MPNSIRMKFASVIPGLWPKDTRHRFGITLGAKTDRAERKTTKPRTIRLPRRHDVLILASRGMSLSGDRLTTELTRRPEGGRVERLVMRPIGMMHRESSLKSRTRRSP